MNAHFNKVNGNRDYIEPLAIKINKSLVIYTYFSSPSSDYNLEFYSKMAITNEANIDFIIVINGNICNVNLPQLPNLKVIYRDNIGFDFGGHKAALDSLNGKQYDYYFFMNSGVLGPFLHDTHPKDFHWTQPFIKKITDKVKLVGTCIMTNPLHGPLIEGFSFMTDHIGLNLLLNKQTIFFNHKTKVDAIHNGEMALAKCMFDENYTIDCMLEKFQGVNWLDKSNWSFNSCEPPSRKGKYFGGSIDPFKVIFHKWYWHNPSDSMVSFDIVENYVNLNKKIIDTVQNIFNNNIDDYKSGPTKFAICMATFQRKNGKSPFYLKRSLDALLNQTASNWHLYLVGDKYENNDEFLECIKFFPKEKITAVNLDVAPERENITDKLSLWSVAGANAYNKATELALADGCDYILHNDDDDPFHIKKIQILNCILTRYSPNCIFHYSTYCNSGKLPKEQIDTISMNNLQPRECNLVHSSLCIHKSIAIQFKYDGYRPEKKEYVPGDMQLIRFINNYNSKCNIFIPLLLCNHDIGGEARIS
jgi:hypothetical protein